MTETPKSYHLNRKISGQIFEGDGNTQFNKDRKNKIKKIFPFFQQWQSSNRSKLAL